MARRIFVPNMTTCFVTNEVPTGATDYSNKTFTLINTPAAGSLAFYVDGERLVDTTDYTIAANVITCNDAPGSSASVIADYHF